MINAPTVLDVDTVTHFCVVFVESHDLCLFERLNLSEVWSLCTGEHVFKRTRDARSAGAREGAQSKGGTPVGEI